MSKCPHCKKKIAHLINYSPAYVKYKLTPDGKYKDLNDSEELGGVDNQYACPECDYTLFIDCPSAILFLQNK